MKVAEWQGKAKAWTEKTGLRRDYAREAIGTSSGRQVYGLGRKLASAEIDKNTIPSGIKPVKSINDFNKMEVPATMQDAVKYTNPNYKKGEFKWKNNCVKCAATYEMRRRGYDVVAKPCLAKNQIEFLAGKDDVAKNEDSWYSMYKNPEVIYVKNKTDIEDVMYEYGNGSRATICVNWQKGGRHVFNIECKDGIVLFSDSQNGIDDATFYFNNIKQGEIELVRVDNLEFSDIITNCCSNKRYKRKTR